MFISILTGLLSAACLAFCGFVYKQMKSFVDDFKTLKDVERNDLKAHIVGVYERAQARGYITHMELDVINRLSTSYMDLGGNSYIESLLYIANHNMEVGGDSIASVYGVVVEQDKDPVLKERAKAHLAALNQDN